MWQREDQLPEGGRHAEGKGREDEGGWKGRVRNQEDERGNSYSTCWTEAPSIVLLLYLNHPKPILQHN